MPNQLDLSKYGIITSEENAVKNNEKLPEKILQKVKKTYMRMGSITSILREEEKEEKQLKEEIASRCTKQFERIREIKMNRRIIGEKILLLQGEVIAYREELKEEGIILDNKNAVDELRKEFVKKVIGTTKKQGRNKNDK